MRKPFTRLRMAQIMDWPGRPAKRMRNLFSPPRFASEEETQRAAVLFYLTWSLVVAVGLTLSVIMMVQPNLVRSSVTIILIVIFSGALLLEANWRGYSREASWILVGIAVLIVTGRSVFAGGIRSPGVGMYVVFVMMAGLLLGEQAGITTAAICLALGLGLLAADGSGIIAQTVPYTPAVYWLLNFLYIALGTAILHMATVSLRRASVRIEAELSERRRTEQRLDLALEAGAVGVWDGDLRSGYFRGDHRAFAIFGVPFPPNGMMSFDEWERLIHPHDQRSVALAVQNMIAGESHTRIVYRITRRSDGALRTIEATAAPIDTAKNRPVFHSGTVIDITERRRAEQSLRVHSRQFALSFEHSPIGMALVAPDGRCLRVNPALVRMLRYSAADLCAMRMQDVTRTAEPAHDIELDLKLRDGEIDSYELPKRYFDRAGEPVDTRVTVTLLRDDRGELVHFIWHIVPDLAGATPDHA